MIFSIKQDKEKDIPIKCPKCNFEVSALDTICRNCSEPLKVYPKKRYYEDKINIDKRLIFDIDKILIYVFCNGYQPNPDLCNTLVLTWIVEKALDFSIDDKKLRSLFEPFKLARKYAFSLPYVDSEAWEGVAKITARSRVEDMHKENRKSFMLFSKAKNPKFPDALIAIVFNANEKDFAKAEELLKLKLIWFVSIISI